MIPTGRSPSRHRPPIAPLFSVTRTYYEDLGDISKVVAYCTSSGTTPPSTPSASEDELVDLLATMEDAYAAGDPMVGEVIDRSFLFNLPDEGADAEAIRGVLPPRLRRRLEEMATS